jgi:polysaccharide biosynthesis protein PslH
MGEKIKILQISPQFPFPPDDGGKIGIANIYREFALNAVVNLVFYTNNEFESGKFEQFNLGGNFIPIDFKPQYSFNKLFISLFSSEPLYVKKHIESKLIRLISRISENIEYDVIHIDHSYMAPIGFHLKSLSGKPVGIRVHNIESKIWQKYAYKFGVLNPKRWYLQRQYELLEAKEVEFFGKADICFAITEKEKQEILQSVPNAKIIVASAGINESEWVPDESIKKNSNEAILATTYKWIHNLEAVKWLVAEVMPIVNKSIQSSKLTLLGKSPPNWLRDYAKYGVDVVGYVDKVQPYLNKAGIYVAPLFVGAGVRIKILEAMAMALPVVATSISAEGIDADESDGLFRADNKERFAEIIIELMKHPENARIKGENARKYVLSRFSWNKSVSLMLEEYRKLIYNK